MASLLSEVSPHLGTNHVIKSAEQAFYGNKTVYSTPQTSAAQSTAEQSTQQRKLKDDIQLAKKVIEDALAGTGLQHSSPGNAEIANLNNEIASLKLDNERLHQEVNELRHLFEKVLNSTGKTGEAPASITTKSQPEASGAAKADDDDFDLFGSDEEAEESEEQKKVREERLAAYAAKKSKKPGPIAKSSVILDVKPWDDETDLKKMEDCVRSVKLEGLNWGAGKLIPVGYGIQKLQIVCTIEDDKVSVDTDLIDFIQDEFANYVQSVDIVAFNKI